ncbi:hypothetical protein V7419_10310 [Bacillus sp. JJ689]|uniref:hypothetical protein n=1 Tax=Bacillus sp. JJ689 TaxID=3122949 RepID=UPI002FFEEF92
MNLGTCCYKGCTKKATTTGFIFGRFKGVNDNKAKFHDLVTCDEHAKEKGFFPDTKPKEN